ncbi:MAG: patatin-like phospholipase family protein [Candidatus Sericytochromatia bacterium]
MKCALVMTGGIAKGAFQAGVIKSFAEQGIKPSVVVGASAGALNAGMVTKLVAEGNFTSQSVEKGVIQPWIYETSIYQLWGKGDITKKDSIRNIFGDIDKNPFLIIKRLANLQMDVWQRLRSLVSMSFFSIFNNTGISDILERNIRTPDRVVDDIICAVSLTDLLAHTEYIKGQPINNYGEFVTFEFKKNQEENLKEKFKHLKNVVQASSCLPGMFSPVELNIKGKNKLYVDGGITKNAPFGRAIKLDPEIEYIFIVTTAPITKPIINEVKDFPSIVGQVYEIIVTKDIANDYRKVVQINEKIKLLSKILVRDENGKVINNEYNTNLCLLAGFKGVEDFLSKRCVEIYFIEPEKPLEGDPFSAIYRNDRRFLLEMYIQQGYESGTKVLKKFINQIKEQDKEKIQQTA